MLNSKGGIVQKTVGTVLQIIHELMLVSQLCGNGGHSNYFIVLLLRRSVSKSSDHDQTIARRGSGENFIFAMADIF